MATSAPRFLGGTAFDLPLAVTMALMVAGLAVSAGGTARIAGRGA